MKEVLFTTLFLAVILLVHKNKENNITANIEPINIEPLNLEKYTFNFMNPPNWSACLL